jgi:hypothetical protein
MARFRFRFSFVAFAFALASMSAAYGCGDQGGGEGTMGEDPVTSEGGSPDSATLEEGGTKPDGEGGTKPSDGGKDAKASEAGTDAQADAAPQGPLSAGYVDYDINHVLMTGQSNIVANGGDPPLTATQPYTNLMFDTGVMPMGTCDGNGCKTYQTPAAFAPLIENDQYFNYQVETSANGLADEISNLAAAEYQFGAHAGYPGKHDVLASNHGRSGNTYQCLRKGFCDYNVARGLASPFAQGMMEVTSAKALAAAAGKSYVVRAAVAVHGESDHYSYVSGTQEFPLDGTDGTPKSIKDYSDGLVEWQRDYEASVKAITGQVQPIPLLISGLSGWTTTRTSQVLQWQLDAHIRAAGKVVYVTPGYIFDVRNDCLHYSNHGQRRLGEYFAKVYSRIVFGGETWEPVRPMQITRAGSVVTVKYYVPKPPLTMDTVHVTDPGNLGFDFVDNGTLVAISSVVVSAADTVTITLAAPPSGVNMRIRYAQNQNTDPATRCIGPGTTYGGGARGNLRDSDATPSKYGYDLWNWGVAFDLAIN